MSSCAQRAYHARGLKHVALQNIRHVGLFEVAKFSDVSVEKVHGRKVPGGFGQIQEPQGIVVTVRSKGVSRSVRSRSLSLTEPLHNHKQ